ncbi:hypothetical protein ACOSQ4_016285 [Xanthoceras sorbifolium]
MVPYSVSSSVGSGFGCRSAGVACRYDEAGSGCGAIGVVCRSVGSVSEGESDRVACRNVGGVSGCNYVGTGSGCKSAEAICRMFRAVVWCRPVGWMTPPISFLKLNMDATWDKGGCRFGLGMDCSRLF